MSFSEKGAAMWISADKRRALAKETSQLPYLGGGSKEVAELATQIRSDILESVFDRFIRPDVARFDPSAPGQLNRAKQLWRELLKEERASYFIELKDSRYVDWIETGEAVVLPCSTDEIESRNRSLPELQGEKNLIQLAREIRATLLKCSDKIEQRLLESGVQAEKRLALRRIREILKKVTDVQWFIKRKPKVFAKYEKLMRSWVENDAS
jgi:hypothetical protein